VGSLPLLKNATRLYGVTVQFELSYDCRSGVCVIQPDVDETIRTDFGSICPDYRAEFRVLLTASEVLATNMCARNLTGAQPPVSQVSWITPTPTPAPEVCTPDRIVESIGEINKLVRDFETASSMNMYATDSSLREMIDIRDALFALNVPDCSRLREARAQAYLFAKHGIEDAQQRRIYPWDFFTRAQSFTAGEYLTEYRRIRSEISRDMQP
jgi:hypothetical protein